METTYENPRHFAEKVRQLRPHALLTHRTGEIILEQRLFSNDPVLMAAFSSAPELKIGKWRTAFMTLGGEIYSVDLKGLTVESANADIHEAYQELDMPRWVGGAVRALDGDAYQIFIKDNGQIDASSSWEHVVKRFGPRMNIRFSYGVPFTFVEASYRNRHSVAMIHADNMARVRDNLSYFKWENVGESLDRYLVSDSTEIPEALEWYLRMNDLFTH